MKIYYTCEYCGEGIDMLEVDQVDEVRFGFDCLTMEERQDIIRLDETANAMHVKSLCDSCIERNSAYCFYCTARLPFVFDIH